MGMLRALFLGEHNESKRGTEDIHSAATAYHEAGHARSARRSGERVLGIWSHGNSGVTKASGTPRELSVFLRTCAAGHAAEVTYLQRQGYSRRDAEAIAAHGSVSDRAQFEEAAKGTTYTWEGVMDDARRFVTWNAVTIEQTAKRLQRRGYDSGTWA